MNARLVRHAIYPLAERLLGRRTFDLLRELEVSQWTSAEHLRRLQLAKLARLLEMAAQRLSRYQPFAGVCGDTNLTGNPFELLTLLPLTDKQTIRDDERVMASRVQRGSSIMSTGGSTGEPLTFHVDRARETFDKAARMRAHRWFGVEPGDKEVYLWGTSSGYRRTDFLRRVRDHLHNDLLLSAFDLSPTSLDAYLRRIDAFNPVSVFGYPSSIVKLCEHARRRDRILNLPRLKAVFVTGEVLDEQQRRSIERYFNVPVADGYGGRDSGFCAHQCPEGGMHVTGEHVLMEIVDAEGRPQPPGVSGEIVITNLDNLATPFIRYRTGDIGRMRDESCPCGRGLALMDVVSGRRTDHLVTADGTQRHALSLIYDLRSVGSVRQFQVLQAEDRSIDVHVVPDETWREDDCKRVIEGVRRCIGHSLNATLHIVDDIEVQPSGKFRHVVSKATATRG